MWECVNCHAELEESFTECWRCGTARSGELNPRFTPVPNAPALHTPPGHPTALRCPHCRGALSFTGIKPFYEGPFNWRVAIVGIFGLPNEDFEVYHCQGCDRRLLVSVAAPSREYLRSAT